MFNSAIRIISIIFIWRNAIVFLIVVIIIVTIIATFDIIRIIIRNLGVMVRISQLSKLLLDALLWLLLSLELLLESWL